MYELSDEVGFIHPSQFAALKEQVGGSPGSSEDPVEHENANFWNKDHKLGISTEIVLPLYKAARNAFMAALRQYKTPEKLPDEFRPDTIETEVMMHGRALLLLSADFGTAWNSRFLHYFFMICF